MDGLCTWTIFEHRETVEGLPRPLKFHAKILMVAAEAFHGLPLIAPGWTKDAKFVITSNLLIAAKSVDCLEF